MNYTQSLNLDDKDKHLSLSKDDLKARFRSHASQDDIDNVFLYLDPDDTGKILKKTFEYYIEGVDQEKKKKALEQIQILKKIFKRKEEDFSSMFDRYDKDGSGFIDLTELSEMLSQSLDQYQV